ncbi:MAG: FAD-dependent oxidoreductase, partial [Firmicutes bacterium]|nr:FAD-dependent oxidoreductase [Bacillota bacterium]
IRDSEGNKFYAVLQLRQEDSYKELYNLVGFQTNLTFSEQKRVFGLIPALKNAEFVRYGVMHRNTYINSPKILTENLNLRENPTVFLAGQLTGVEGYCESAGSGIIAGLNMARILKGEKPIIPSKATMLGSLLSYISAPNHNFQPMHVSYEIAEKLCEEVKDKEQRRKKLALRARECAKAYESAHSAQRTAHNEGI